MSSAVNPKCFCGADADWHLDAGPRCGAHTVVGMEHAFRPTDGAYERGVAEERRRVVEWLRGGHRRSRRIGPDELNRVLAPSALADQIERGEHAKPPQSESSLQHARTPPRNEDT